MIKSGERDGPVLVLLCFPVGKNIIKYIIPYIGLFTLHEPDTITTGTTHYLKRSISILSSLR